MINQLEYNTEREHLIIPEYGRHIQKMINYTKTIKDDEERNKKAKSIIAVMGNMQPHLRDVPDFQHKLWDQLFIMSNFELDVDSPYDKPTESEFKRSPAILRYPQNFPKYRFYGNNIKTMIDAAKTWEDGKLKTSLIYAIANHMKKCFLNWNKDTVEDLVIYNHLFELSEGEIDLRNSKEDLSESSNLIGQKQRFSSHKKPYQRKRSNNNNRQRKRS